MLHKDEIIKQLKLQNSNPDVTSAQKEANNHRIEWLEILSREKPVSTKRVFLDTIYTALTMPEESITPASLLRGDK